MRFPNLTSFIAKSFSWLKEIPLLPIFIDEQFKIFIFIFNPYLFFLMSKIVKEVSSWNGVNIQNHRYGGVEFKINNKEIGHLHSSGLLDILFDKKTKDTLLEKKQISEHHVFENTGWGSFYLNKNTDYKEVINLLQISYLLKK